MVIFLRERECPGVVGGGKERKPHADYPGMEPDIGLHVTTLKSGPEQKPRVENLTN